MERLEPTPEHLSEAIRELPAEALPDLAHYIEYLIYRTAQNISLSAAPKQRKTGVEFLLAITGLGSSEETDLSERVEEVLANEIDPIRGWTLHPNKSQ